jgi:BMFP domain-containing protein YqiC
MPKTKEQAITEINAAAADMLIATLRENLAERMVACEALEAKVAELEAKLSASTPAPAAG